MDKIKKLIDPIVGGGIEDYYNADSGDDGIRFYHAGTRFLVLHATCPSVSHLPAKRGHSFALVIYYPKGMEIPLRTHSPSSLCTFLREFAARPYASECLDDGALITAYANLRDCQQTALAVLAAQYAQSVRALEIDVATRSSKLAAAIDARLPEGSYILCFSGYPPSCDYVTLKEAKRAHSKRNLPGVECTIENHNTKVCTWNTEQRYWQYC